MILVVGCGYLGSYVVKNALESTCERVIATVRDVNNAPEIQGVEFFRLDITSEDDIKALYEHTKNERLTVFYFSACHNIDFVFENPQEAEKINCRGLESFLEIMVNIDKLFFASTDCVYGENGDLPLLGENAPLMPVNEYGKQKIKAEKIVISKGFTVTRLPFMMGPSLLKKPHFYDRICSQLKNGEAVEMVDGLYRSVLTYDKTAKYLLELSKKDKLPPAINVCGDKGLSKYEIGCMIAEEIGADKSLVRRLTEEQGRKFFKDRRSSVSVMDNSLLKSLLA